jgi:hypothetical protein
MASSSRHLQHRQDRLREQRRSCLVERRSGLDLRMVYSLDYFAAGGAERRRGAERRSGRERRAYWEMGGMPCVSRPD